MANDPFIGCTLKRLPQEQHIEAAKQAVAINPANKPLIASVVPLPPSHLALLTSRLWPAKGCHLTVQFLDNPQASVRKRILDHANKWSSRANIQFSETASQGQIRLARNRGDGYWSYLGTDILSIPAGQATMNLDSFNDSTPESEYLRVVPHEFGHSAGMVHEHLRRALVQKLDVQKTLAYFERTQGWSADEVRAQVLTPIEEALLSANSPDQLSIMCYQISGECTIDGQPIIGGVDIDESDFQLASTIYPLTVIPPPKPPPPPSGGPTVDAVQLAVDQAIEAITGKQRTLCRPAITAARTAAATAIRKAFGG